VAEDRGVQGEDRVRSLSVIAGEPGLETVHVEHGLRFVLDPSKVYFSPRLATERLRVAGLVKEGESVLDMFAGVGPFSIHIAKRAQPSVVRAADINPAAIEYMRKNIRLNKATGVEPMLIDAKELPKKMPPADRIIMNLPHSAFGFLPVALRLLRPGGTIHLYEIIDRERKAERKDAVAGVVERAGRRLLATQLRLVRGYSAAESHFVFDLSMD
jgi:tRNA (guanine37-N1)-methyltransferase